MVEIRAMFARLIVIGDGGSLAKLHVKSNLSQQIKERQLVNDSLGKKIR